MFLKSFDADTMNEVAHNIQKKQEVAERWLPVVGYEGFYEVSNFGRVRRIRKRQYTYLRPTKNRGLYMRVVLHVDRKPKTFTVHRLVALSFVANPDSKPEIDHINGNRQDNRAENLQWVTRRENLILSKMRDGSWWKENRDTVKIKKPRADRRGVRLIKEPINGEGAFSMNKTSFESMTFQEIWSNLNAEERNELARKLFAARCCSTYQTIWNWGKGKVSPASPLVRDKVASTISKLTGKNTSSSTLFPSK